MNNLKKILFISLLLSGSFSFVNTVNAQPAPFTSIAMNGSAKTIVTDVTKTDSDQSYLRFTAIETAQNNNIIGFNACMYNSSTGTKVHCWNQDAEETTYSFTGGALIGQKYKLTLKNKLNMGNGLHVSGVFKP